MAIKLTEGLNFFGGDKIRLKGKFDKKTRSLEKFVRLADQFQTFLTSYEMV
jgi:hypothetical protein